MRRVFWLACQSNLVPATCWVSLDTRSAMLNIGKGLLKKMVRGSRSAS